MLRPLASAPQAEADKLAQQFLTLGKLLLKQAHAGEWDAAKQTDGRIVQFAQTFSAQQPERWAQMAPVRAQVKEYYREAVELCRLESERLKQAWQTFNAQREGVEAYDEAQQWR
ncbi:MAG: LafX [Aeromonas sp.]